MHASQPTLRVGCTRVAGCAVIALTAPPLPDVCFHVAVDKGRVKMVQEQLKERNDQLTKQEGDQRDLHAQATKRPTFNQTFAAQMSSLDAKIDSLE